MYKINEMAKLAGISTRTLRYYDQIELLKPYMTDENGYRFYGPSEVNHLQQILFFKELGYSLDQIKQTMKNESYNHLESLHSHLRSLHTKKAQIERVMDLVNETISTIERGEIMADKKKFEAFKKDQIDKNMVEYGAELEQKYDSEFIQQANQKYQKKSKFEIKTQDQLTQKLNKTIKQAVKSNDPSSEIAQEMCELHKQWICFYWPNYSKKNHLSLVETYTLDDRFKQYYDKIIDGAADFLLSAMKIYIEK